MSSYAWLLALHVTGAFLLLGGSIVAAIFNVLSSIYLVALAVAWWAMSAKTGA